MIGKRREAAYDSWFSTASGPHASENAERGSISIANGELASISIECTKIDESEIASLPRPQYEYLESIEWVIESVGVEGNDNNTAEITIQRRVRIRLRRPALAHVSSEGSRKRKRPG